MLSSPSSGPRQSFRGLSKFQWSGIIVLLTAGCGPTRSVPVDSQKLETILPVNAMVARLEVSDGESRLFSGFVQSAQATDLGFGRGGRIAKISVKEGDLVEVDQILAELDDQRLENKRDRLVEARDKAQQQLDSIPAAAPLPSLQQLINGLNSIQGQARELSNKLVAAAAAGQPQSAETEQTLEQLAQQISALNTSAIERQRNELERLIQELDVQVEDVNLELKEGLILAPFSGTVELRGLGIGSMVSAGTPVVRVLDVSDLLVTASIPAGLASGMMPGTTVSIQVGEDAFVAITQSISPELDQTSRTRRVTYQLEERAAESVLPGVVASVVVRSGGNESGFWLPHSAVVRDVQGLWSIMVAEPVDEAWIASRRYVELIRLETERVFVRGLLDDGEWVISDGLQRIVPGQKVNAQVLTTQETSAELNQLRESAAEGSGVPPG